MGKVRATFGDGDNIVEMEVQGGDFLSEGEVSDNGSEISEEINQSEVDEGTRAETSGEEGNTDRLNESTVSEAASVHHHHQSPRRWRKQRRN